MSNLRSIELELMDHLTGMSSGYVLNFTNKTFQEFFMDEVGVNIYDDAYADGGESKGKRLRSFFRKGQPTAVCRAIEALWEYREIGRMNAREEETIPNCHSRLTAIVERLGARPLKIYDKPKADEVTTPIKKKIKGPDASLRQDLLTEFQEMHGMAPHPRGYAFEKFLKKFFEAWNLNPRAGFRNSGEQIDGSFTHRDAVYLLEAKWHSELVNAATLHSFQGKIYERPSWTRGLFISYSGFSSEAFDAFTSKQIILMDGLDIHDTLNMGLHLDDVIDAKLRHAVERKSPFARARELLI